MERLYGQGARIEFPFSQIWEKGLGDEGSAGHIDITDYLIHHPKLANHRYSSAKLATLIFNQ
jgi:hypothetical protein